MLFLLKLALAAPFFAPVMPLPYHRVIVEIGSNVLIQDNHLQRLKKPLLQLQQRLPGLCIDEASLSIRC